MYWFDNYSAGVSLLCSALFEAIAISYVYGILLTCVSIHTIMCVINQDWIDLQTTLNLWLDSSH